MATHIMARRILNGRSSVGPRVDAAALGPVLLGIGVEVIGVTQPAFVLIALGTRHTVALGGIGVQPFRFGLSALGLRGLHFGIGVGLLGFGPALLRLGLASMQLVFGLGCLLADPGSFFALMFALLRCGLPTHCDDDADDDENGDDHDSCPDDGSGIHALSPSCPFGCR